MSRARRRLIALALVASAAIWIATIALALDAIRKFESTPGVAADAPQRWPEVSAIDRNPNGSTLVMLIHPHCSCSRASIRELAEIIDAAPRTLRTFVFVYRPKDAAAGWEQTDVTRAAAVLRRTTLVIDEDGAMARRFGGITSGQTLLYDREGRLRYAGGVTSLRGHAGLNGGRVAVIRLANTESGKATHPVFGCAITSRGSQR